MIMMTYCASSRLQLVQYDDIYISHKHWSLERLGIDDDDDDANDDFDDRRHVYIFIYRQHPLTHLHQQSISMCNRT